MPDIVLKTALLFTNLIFGRLSTSALLPKHEMSVSRTNSGVPVE
jgi:hypothetical protein